MKLEKEISQNKFNSTRHKVVINIAYTYNWLYEKHVREFKPYDITVQQFNILRILRGQHPDPATIKLLKERMLDKMSDASRLVEKLRTKGLVERNLCDHDRRNVDVRITKKGLDLLETLDKHEKKINDSLSSLTDIEIEKLNHLLDKLRG